MLESLLQQTTIPLLEQVAAFGSRRHSVLAGNIANIDTPDYRTRDLPVQDFEKAVQSAINARHKNMQPQLTWSQTPGNVSLNPVFPDQGQGGELPPGATSLHVPGVVQQQPQQLADYFPAELGVARDAASANVTFHDGGNRSIEHESMEMSKNASLQSFAIEVMLSQMRTLEAVISERAV
ncbi:flagellar basal body rod protein FlgB [Rubinisphaera sp. JC750]|uniref:flagellar basal body rod protein FlgB n=1 Tax=Rubinisphaera sp. JC750 TaxID=2898658 RepID=UPI001F232C70|nr:hypothetical protein [Rubinisphaera sp. JC750]